MRAWFFAAALDTLPLPILLMIIIPILNMLTITITLLILNMLTTTIISPITPVLIKVRVRFCAAAVDTRFLAVIGGEMDGEVGRSKYCLLFLLFFCCLLLLVFFCLLLLVFICRSLGARWMERWGGDIFLKIAKN